jgi:hypothetical protein
MILKKKSRFYFNKDEITIHAVLLKENEKNVFCFFFLVFTKQKKSMI